MSNDPITHTIWGRMGPTTYVHEETGATVEVPENATAGELDEMVNHARALLELYMALRSFKESEERARQRNVQVSIKQLKEPDHG